MDARHAKPVDNILSSSPGPMFADAVNYSNNGLHSGSFSSVANASYPATAAYESTNATHGKNSISGFYQAPLQTPKRFDIFPNFSSKEIFSSQGQCNWRSLQIKLLRIMRTTRRNKVPTDHFYKHCSTVVNSDLFVDMDHQVIAAKRRGGSGRGNNMNKAQGRHRLESIEAPL